LVVDEVVLTLAKIIHQEIIMVFLEVLVEVLQACVLMGRQFQVVQALQDKVMQEETLLGAAKDTEQVVEDEMQLDLEVIYWVMEMVELD
jgi:hypothetical protein